MLLKELPYPYNQQNSPVEGQKISVKLHITNIKKHIVQFDFDDLSEVGMDEKNKPKKPEIEKAIYDIGSFWFVCPVCYSILNIGENCQTCKQVIDWSEQT